jgi:hypothetical protein
MSNIKANSANFFPLFGKPLPAIPYLALATILGTVLGFILSIRFILPLLISVPVYILMINLLKQGERKKAVVYMLLWALILGLVMTFACYLYPEKSEGLIIRGSGYRNEMFDWIKTGIGKEGTPSQFIPEHLLHLGVFIALSLVTISAASILFGTILMNYMAFYVAQLMLHTDNKFLVFIVGWHFWSLFRIAGFVILGVVLAEPVLHRVFKYKWRLKDTRPYLMTAALLIILDMTCKAIFAPAVGEYVKKLVNL